jgi:hypothetical protein
MSGPITRVGPPTEAHRLWIVAWGHTRRRKVNVHAPSRFTDWDWPNLRLELLLGPQRCHQEPDSMTVQTEALLLTEQHSGSQPEEQ